jgi:hypothetical protein
MADDTKGTVATGGSQKTEVAPAPANAGTAKEKYLLDYVTKADAERGLKEKDKTISELQSERDKSKATLAALQAESERNVAMREIVKQLADLKKPEAEAASSGPTAEDWKALEEELEGADGKTHAAILRHFAGQVESYVQGKTASERKSLEGRIDQLVGKLNDLERRSDSTYVRHRETVDALVAKGLDFKSALLVAPELDAAKTPPAETPAGGAGGVRTVAEQEGTEMPPEVEQYALREMNMDPKMLARIKNRMQAERRSA